MFLLMIAYMMFTSTFGHMVQAGVELVDMDGNYANLLFMLSLIFCGVLIGPNLLPRFWIFMYRVSPFTYIVSAVLSTGLANAPITCSSIELLHFNPLPNTTCSSYLSAYLQTAGGYLSNPEAMESCAYCPLKDTNAFLKLISSDYETRWRDFGILWVYIVVNIALAMFWYWLARVPKNKRARTAAPAINVEEKVERPRDRMALRGENWPVDGSNAFGEPGDGIGEGDIELSGVAGVVEREDKGLDDRIEVCEYTRSGEERGRSD